MVTSADEGVTHRKQVEASLAESRISVKVESVVQAPDRTVLETLKVRSSRADLVFLGLARVEAGAEEVYAERLIELLEGMPSAILVRNGSPFQGSLV